MTTTAVLPELTRSSKMAIPERSERADPPRPHDVDPGRGTDGPSRHGDIQLDMLYDYRTNVPLYPQFQDLLRKYQPPTLIVWGKNDFIFPPEGAIPYKRDLPNVETHLLDTGHFALETHGEEIASRIEHFFGHQR